MTNLAERSVQVKDNTIALKTQIAAKPLDASGEAASIYIYCTLGLEYKMQMIPRIINYLVIINCK